MPCNHYLYILIISRQCLDQESPTTLPKNHVKPQIAGVFYSGIMSYLDSYSSRVFSHAYLRFAESL